MQKRANVIEKNNRTLQEKLEYLEEKYGKLKELLELNNLNYSNSEKFHLYMRNYEKKSDLEATIIEREDKIKNLKHKIAEKNKFLETLRKAVEIEEKGNQTKESQKAANLNEEFISKNKIVERISEQEKVQEHLARDVLKYKQTSLNSILILHTLSSKLDPSNKEVITIGDVDWEQLKSQFSTKMKTIQEKMDEKDYKHFLEGTFDFTAVYKKLLLSEADFMANYSYYDRREKDDY